MKRFLSVFVVLLLIFALCVPAAYADDVPGGIYSYGVDGDTYLVVKLDGEYEVSCYDEELTGLLEDIKDSIDQLNTSGEEEGEYTPNEVELQLMSSLDSANNTLNRLATAVDAQSVASPYDIELITHLGNIEAFMIFFIVVLVCFFVYKFLRIFF